MARVNYGPGITDFKGSIGGVTFQNNTSGSIARLRTRAVVNPTALQAGYQARLSYLVSLWPTLTQVQKDAWDTFHGVNNHTTPWGETKILSGYQWFLSCNLRRMLYHAAAIVAAPAWVAQVVPDTFTIETAAGYIRVAWAPDYNAPLDLIAYCSLPLKQSSLKLRRSLFWIKNYAAAPLLTNWDLTSEIEALFNVTWATFYASSKCNIIIRLLQGDFAKGLFSSFVSAIIKIN